MNVVEYLVRIRDMASGQMRTLATNADGAFSRISARINRVGSNVDSLNSRIDQLTRTRNMSLDIRQIERANREIEQLERRRDRLENRGRSGAGNMWATGLVMGGIALAGAGLVTTLKAGMERQMASTSFEVMAGKADGDKLHKNLMGFATDTIYGNEVFGEAKTLLGFGVQAKNIMPTLKMLGDVAMGDAERMRSLSLAFAQTAAAGKLTGSDMLQYVNAGFNPLQAIREKTGANMAKLKKDMSDGKISFKQVAEALEYATGAQGRFHNGMKKMGETPTGKWMAFTGALQTFAGTVGTGLLPVLGGVTDLLTGLMGNEPLMYGIAAAIGAMTAAWGLYTLYTKRAVIWQGILAVVAYWPLALIGATIGLITYLCLKYDSWGKSAKALWSITKNIGEGTYTIFKDMVQGIGFSFEWLWLKSKDIFQHIGGLIDNLQKSFQLALKFDFSGAKKALTQEIKTTAGGELDKLTKQWNSTHKLNQQVIQNAFRDGQFKGIHFDTKGGKNLKKEATDWMSSKFDFSAGAGGKGMPDGVADTAKGIAGGGVRNITINIQKQGIDQVTIHTSNLPEGVQRIREEFIQMFNQVINSGNAMLETH